MISASFIHMVVLVITNLDIVSLSKLRSGRIDFKLDWSGKVLVESNLVWVDRPKIRSILVFVTSVVTGVLYIYIYFFFFFFFTPNCYATLLFKFKVVNGNYTITINVTKFPIKRSCNLRCGVWNFIFFALAIWDILKSEKHICNVCIPFN